MPMIFSQRDFTELVESDDELVRLIDAAERSLLDLHSGDAGHTFFTDLPLANENATTITGTSVGDEHAILRVFPSGANTGSRDDAAFIVVMDSATGGLRAVLSGDDLNTLRTAVPAGLGARHLAPKDASVLTVLGSSEQARGHARILTRALPQISQVVVWSPTPESRERFANEQSIVLGLPVRACETAEEAVTAGDVITAAGRTRPWEAAYEASWVRPGALAISMTNSAPEQLRESSRFVVPTLNRAEVIAFGFAGKIKIKPAPDPEGVLQLADVIEGRAPARTDETQTVVFELANLYLWDQPIMTRALEWAMQRGLGTNVELTADSQSK